MEPGAGPQKLCPQCGQPVLASDRVCGFCGHVLGAEVDTSSWNEPRVYRFSTSVLIMCWVMFGGLGIAMVCGAIAGAGRNTSLPTWLMAAMASLFISIAVFATYSWRVKRVTLFADRVEWVGALGGAQSCPYAELTVVEHPGVKSGPVFKIGRDGGPKFELNADLTHYKELADELRLRSAIVRRCAKGST